MTSQRNFLRLIVTICSLCAFSLPSLAETFPSRPVKILVQTAAGSSIDVSARILAQALSKKWGQQAFVVNQPGAGGFFAARALQSSAADGYTLFFAASSVFVALPVIRKEIAPAVASFAPIAFIGEQPMAISVAANSKTKTLADLIALSKATPGGINCAVSTRGGLSHLTGEYLKAASGMDLTFINYPGTAQTLTDIVGGRVPMSVESLSALIGPATGGEIRILAVASAQRLPTLPDVPTVAETVPGFEATAWFVLVAPKGTPPEVVDKISNDVHAILSENAIRDQMLKLSTFIKDVPLAELPAFIAAQRKKWSPIVEKFAVKTK